MLLKYYLCLSYAEHYAYNFIGLGLDHYKLFSWGEIFIDKV